MLLIGLVDDRRAIPAASKGLAQGLTIAIALLVWRPSGALSGWVPLAISWLVFMVLVNAWNYLDHADGIFTTVGASASLILAIGCGLLSETRSPAIGSVDRLPALISLSLLGALLGFLVFNRPPARIFLGDAGSLPIGFLLAMTGAWILDRGNVLLRPAVAAAFAVPVADMLLVSVTRLREGRNPFEGGREHTGHRLASRFGPMAAVLVIGTVSVLFGVLGLTLGSSLPAMALVLVSAGILLTAALLARIPPPA
jgi:UDP-GlcNAc:undecaprenyl-phosphate/decaprenyl-phosphate GlcNAc-1-phosphate transferase